MRLWSIQSEIVNESLKQHGIYHCDIKKSDLASEECFHWGYEWMKKELVIQLHEENAADSYPIWAWHKHNGKCRKPDLRKSGYAPKGSRCILLELEIPQERLLLSDFDLWHFVLMDTCLYDSDEDEEYFNTLTNEEQIIEKEKSWKKIFDIAKSEYIQASFLELNLYDVISVKPFIAK